jgi:uncharacterized integral membrane protein
MDVFSKVTISNFIWYLVPGLELIFFLLFPILVYKPQSAMQFFNAVGPFGLIIIGIVFGFFLDGLRLYRLRWDYKKIKDDFFNELKKIIEGVENPYIIQSAISDLARNKNISGLSLHHAIWIMLGHFTILSFLEAFYWMYIFLYFYYVEKSTYSLFGIDVSYNTFMYASFGFFLLFLIVGIRLLYISTEDQKNTNNMFLGFAKNHSSEIKQLLKVQS